MSSVAASTQAVDPATLEFDKMMREFRSNLKDEAMYKEILKTKSIDQVYDLTEAIQTEQAKTGHLRHLSKIQPFLEGMRHYSDAIDTFVQAKPDILALIWGPMKLLIQWTSTLSKSQDAIAKVTAEIGDLLPEFHDMTALFSHNKRLKDVMALFFQDILDFYLISLRFFSKSRLKYVLEALWPKEKEKIDLVKSRIERHATLMRTQVRSEHIKEEHEARVRAMESFEKFEREHRRQEYYRLLTDINPRFHDSKLDEISGRLCVGTGEWLLRDDKFTRWLDPAMTKDAIMWLEGIPGAGKTYLACTAIKTCQHLGRRTVYAFLTHSLSASTSALSVLHSLIFQLAWSSEDLQGVLCHSSRQDIKCSLDCAAAVLRLLVDFAGPTWFVVDGLDEMNLTERQRLLLQLRKLTEECEAIKILICSRAESDIERALGTSPTVRVDHNNLNSIEIFVKHETTEWLSRRYFGHEDRAEIEGLLSPLAAKADGMFLYTKIVFSCLELLSDIREVRKELLVLPKDLNDAYSRILGRINNLSPIRAKTKARRLLGFIGCSPEPLTIYELDQLLTLDLYEGLERTVRPSICSLNPVELCGPIVEIVDEYVRFVHFTVQEYLFSSDIAGSLNNSDMLLDLTTSCLRYLCQDHHRPDLSKDEIDKAVLCGLYQMHAYTENTWYGLVEKCLALPDCTSVLESLEKLAPESLREETEVMDHAPTAPSILPKMEILKEQRPRVYQLLDRASEFHRRCQFTDFHTGNLSRWRSIDPLQTSDLRVNIHKAYDRLLCWSYVHSKTCCSYLSLRTMYGSRIFKCPYLGCSMRSRGFENKSLRVSHAATHDRPWRCDVAGCEYSETGFLSRRMRDDHLDNFHRDNEAETHTIADNPANSISDGKIDQIKDVFMDLVLADRKEELESLSIYFQRFGEQSRRDIIHAAAQSGSAKIVALMFDLAKQLPVRSPDLAVYYVESDINERDTMPLRVLYFACEGKNMEVMEWLLENTDTRLPAFKAYPIFDINHRSYGDWGDILSSVLESESDVMFRSLLHEFTIEFTTPRAKEKHSPAERAMCRKVFRACGSSLDGEERLLELWKRMHPILKDGKDGLYKASLGSALCHIAETICSIQLAKVVLQRGADVNCIPKGCSYYRTPLFRGLRKSTAKSARWVEFLLYRGAGVRRMLEDEVGAKEISKWLGMTWDELVQKVRADREVGICPAEYL